MAEQNVTLPVTGSPGTANPVVEGISGFGGAVRQVTATVDYPKAPQALAADTVVDAGTAITVASGPFNGGFVTNPANSDAQGIDFAENAYIDLVATPGSTDAEAFGTTLLLSPGQTFTLPALASGVNVKVNAATAGHRLSGTIW